MFFIRPEDPDSEKLELRRSPDLIFFFYEPDPRSLIFSLAVSLTENRLLPVPLLPVWTLMSVSRSPLIDWRDSDVYIWCESKAYSSRSSLVEMLIIDLFWSYPLGCIFWYRAMKSMRL